MQMRTDGEARRLRTVREGGVRLDGAREARLTHQGRLWGRGKEAEGEEGSQGAAQASPGPRRGQRGDLEKGRGTTTCGCPTAAGAAGWTVPPRAGLEPAQMHRPSV